MPPNLIQMRFPAQSDGMHTSLRYQPSPMYLWRIGLSLQSHFGSQLTDGPGSPTPCASQQPGTRIFRVAPQSCFWLKFPQTPLRFGRSRLGRENSHSPRSERTSADGSSTAELTTAGWQARPPHENSPPAEKPRTQKTINIKLIYSPPFSTVRRSVSEVPNRPASTDSLTG